MLAYYALQGGGRRSQSAQRAVELDGAPHFMSGNFGRDDVREEYLLREHGIRIIRFENRDLFYNPDGVVKVILSMIQKMKGR